MKDTAATAALSLADDIRPLLKGKDPDIQGAVLSELLALFIAGHHPQLRDHAMRAIIACTLDLVRVNDEMLYGPKGFPVDNTHIN